MYKCKNVKLEDGVITASASLTFFQRPSTFHLTFDVAVSVLVCGHFGLSLWPFGLICGHFSRGCFYLWPFRM